MRKSLAAVMAAITVGGAVATAALPAQAQRYERHDHHRHRNDAAGAAIAAGIVGLALGAALTSNHNNYSYGPHYDRGYYPRGYYYEPGYRVCESRRWVWDPYIGRRVLIRSRYAC